MRRLVLAALMIGLAQGAFAADMPDLPVLRGFVSDTPRNSVSTNWEGVYVGGQAGYGSADVNFSGATAQLAHQLLVNLTMENEFQISNWPVLGKETSHSAGFGGFVGYNWQWEDAVVGVELNYLHTNLNGVSTGSMGRSFTTSDGYINDVTYDASGSIKIKDMGTARVRAAYSWNGFLPYVFGAAAAGLADLNKSVHIHGFQDNSSKPAPFDHIVIDYAAAENHDNRLIVGFGGGTGVDIMLFNGVFVRAEYEFLRFIRPADTSVQTGRIGAGVKF